jgi:hypothetical protein
MSIVCKRSLILSAGKKLQKYRHPRASDNFIACENGHVRADGVGPVRTLLKLQTRNPSTGTWVNYGAATVTTGIQYKWAEVLSLPIHSPPVTMEF